MRMENKSIPNIGIKNIATGRKPLKAIKGFIELPCWTDYFLTEESNYLFKTKVVKNGWIELWVDGQIYKDNGTYEEVEKELKNKKWKLPKKKKWWQIW